MRCNGVKIRELREKMCITQDKLASLSYLDRRTIQRAEAGSPLSLESLADIAAALKVKVSDITLQADNDDGNEDIVVDNNAVVLRRVVSGKHLLDMLKDNFSGSLTCEVEPTTENIDTIAGSIEEIEKLIPDPWEWTPGEKFSLADHLRSAVKLSEKIKILEEVGVAIFAGSYTASAIVPLYDPYEGLHIRNSQKPEPVTVSRIVLADPSKARIVLRVNDVWEEPKPTPVEELDDIPF
jgi:transcriptional regulator with XRE-family HTH domain